MYLLKDVRPDVPGEPECVCVRAHLCLSVVECACVCFWGACMHMCEYVYLCVGVGWM